MARAKTTLQRNKSGRKTYILKRRLATPKSVKFGNMQFMVRYDRIRTKNLKSENA